jgi:hypothetical protein
MTTVNIRRLKIMTYLGLLCLVIAWETVCLWIRAFNAGTSHPDRVQIYKSYFPSFLNLGSITLIDLILCITAIIISSICLKLKATGWKILNIIIIAGCGLRLLLTLFGLM